jgi:hypothetical protein
MPLDVEMVHSFEADDYRKAESKLHSICNHNGWHHEGEWFDLPDGVVETICSIDRYRGGFFLNGNNPTLINCKGA